MSVLITEWTSLSEWVQDSRILYGKRQHSNPRCTLSKTHQWIDHLDQNRKAALFCYLRLFSFLGVWFDEHRQPRLLSQAYKLYEKFFISQLKFTWRSAVMRLSNDCDKLPRLSLNDCLGLNFYRGVTLQNHFPKEFWNRFYCSLWKSSSKYWIWTR